MIKDLEAVIGYQFRNITLLQQALTHSSYANERWHDGLRCNERLEFLGDAVLDMVVAEELYHKYPDRLEGDLTRMRAEMVCERALAEAANKMGLGEYLLLGHGEEQGGGRQRPSILSDAVEAVIAAAYLDGGMDAATGIIYRFVIENDVRQPACSGDYKTALQEQVQKKKDQHIQYELLEQSGPDHAKVFRVAVSINGEVVGIGTGSSKKRAEQEAAKAAYQKLFR
jgi:ribonuclease-3